MLKKIEYNTFDAVLKDLVIFFSSVLFVLLLSTYALASEYDVKEIVTEGRAVIIDGDKKLAKKRALDDALYIASLRGGAKVDGYSNVDSLTRLNENLLVRPESTITDFVIIEESSDKTHYSVKIKAYLVSVDQDYLQELGLNWQQHQKLNSNIKSSGNSAFYLDKILSLSQGALDLKIKALEEHGRGELLSSPELITTNGQTAIIETGDEIPYLQSQQDGSNTLVFKKAVLRLQVKPEIIANSKVKMHVVINQDQPGFSYGDALAIKTRKIVTDAMVLDSKTLALGGIFESYKAITKTGVPLLKELPFLGNIFTMTDKKTKKRQLVIFITPFILP